MTNISCGTCLWYKQLAGQGECRRFPPSAEMGGSWPVILPNGWCGEFTVVGEESKGGVPTVIEAHQAATEAQEKKLKHKRVFTK